MPGHSAGIDSRTGIEALKIALDRHQANSDLELVHYPQPLLREADLLAQQMSAQIPPRQRRWLGLQMLEGDIYSRAYAGDAADKLDIALANLSDEIDDPALHIADALSDHRRHLRRRQQYPDRRTKPLHRRDGQSDPQPLPRVADFLFVMYLMFLLAINIGGALQPIFDAGSVAIFVHGIQWLGYTLHFPDWLTVFLAQGSAAVSTPCCRWCRRSA